MANRNLRLNSLLRSELNKLILKELDLPDGVLATISDVAVAKNLKNADVLISVFPSDRGEEIIKTFSRWQGEAQFLLNRKLNIRPVPRIRFVLDEGLGNAAKIEKLMMDTVDKTEENN
ncbi:MAG TPA: 30S ribosome-binding factor RbfA [Candidatus Paceibacterota bacterium]